MSRFPAVLPHGPLTRVADGVFTVRGTFRMGRVMTISRTMTVLDAGAGLVVLNAIRLSEFALSKLDALGRVTHLVKLSDSHGVDEPFYIDRYAPQVWALPGARLTEGATSSLLAGEGPIAGGAVIDLSLATRWRESAYWVPLAGGTLVTCDAIQNCADTEGASVMFRLFGSVLGFKGGVIQPPMWRRLQKLPASLMGEVLGGMLPLSFENLVTGHGPPVIGGADALVRAAINRVAR